MLVQNALKEGLFLWLMVKEQSLKMTRGPKLEWFYGKLHGVTSIISVRSFLSCIDVSGLYLLLYCGQHISPSIYLSIWEFVGCWQLSHSLMLESLAARFFLFLLPWWTQSLLPTPHCLSAICCAGAEKRGSSQESALKLVIHEEKPSSLKRSSFLLTSINHSFITDENDIKSDKNRRTYVQADLNPGTGTALRQWGWKTKG